MQHPALLPALALGPVLVAPVQDGGQEEMGPYRERIPGSEVAFDMVPVPGGRFTMGSPTDEPGRGEGEGPRHEVELEPFWMGRCEVTWDEYHVFMLALDLHDDTGGESGERSGDDAVTRPTPPYVPMDFEMGVGARPAICMTQLAAKQYTRWLSQGTGRFYRLPTEAEWEYACRAGTETAYSFGDDPGDLDEHAWYVDNAEDSYHEVGLKEPNPWGLHDMHGNVAEWVLDRLDAGFYGSLGGAAAKDPIAWPTELYPRVVRGGSWDDEAARLRSAARRGSTPAWKVRDPQLPKSIWYHTDAPFVGFRVVRPLRAPPEEERSRFWDPDLESVSKILERQRRGGR